jgi:hypothetical protein
MRGNMSVCSRQSMRQYTLVRRGLLTAAIVAVALFLPMTAFAQGKSKMELQSFDPLTQNVRTFTWDGRRGLDASMSRPNHFVQDTRLLRSGSYNPAQQSDLFGTRMNRVGSGNRFGAVLGQTVSSGRGHGAASRGKASTGLRSSQTMLSPSLLDPVGLGMNGGAFSLGASGGGSASRRTTSRSRAHRP